MAINASYRNAFIDFKAGYAVYETAFEYQFIKEKRRREAALRRGVRKEDLEPFSAGLVKAAVNVHMLRKAEIPMNQCMIFESWRKAASFDDYSSAENPEQARKRLSNIIDDVYSASPWGRIVIDKNIRKKAAAKDTVPTAPGTPESLLMDFAWYYENIHLLDDVKIQATLDTYRKQKYAITLQTEYPEEFIARISSTALKELYGATEAEIEAFSESPFSTPQEKRAAIEGLFLPLSARNGYDLSEMVDSDTGYVYERPVYNVDGRPDFVAAMRQLRHVRYLNARASASASRSGIDAEAAYGRGYISYGRMYLTDDFTNLVLNDPNGPKFLAAIGVDLNAPYYMDQNGTVTKTIGGMLFSDEAYNLKNVWNAEKDKRTVNEKTGKLMESRRTESVKNILMVCIAGRRPNWEEKKPGICSVVSCGKISCEFAKRATEIDCFLEEFKRQNDYRKNSGWKAPFSDDFIIRCRDRGWLEKIGMPEENINKLLAFRMDENNLNDYMRRSFSNMLGGNMGIRSTKAYTGEKDDIALTPSSSIPDIYRRLRKESGRCYQLSQRQSAADRYTYIYSDDLLEALFRTDILEKVRAESGFGDNPSYTQKTELAERWINALPEDSVLIDVTGLAHPDVKGRVSKKSLIEGLKKENKDASSPSDYAAKIFSMLVHSDYRKGDNSYWTEKLKLGQRSTFAQAMNRDMIGLFTSWGSVFKSREASLSTPAEYAGPMPTSTYFLR